MEKGIDRHFGDRWRAISGVDDMVGCSSPAWRRWACWRIPTFFSFPTTVTSSASGASAAPRSTLTKRTCVPFFAPGPGIAPGTRLTALGSNIDIAPTLIDIAGLPANPEHDGRRLLPMLTAGSLEQGAVWGGWRTSLLIEYIGVGTYFNDHAKLWVSGPAATPGTQTVYVGPMAKDPNMASAQCVASELDTPGAGEGKCWFVDSKASNNWLALRIRNATANLLYVESFGEQATAARFRERKGGIQVPHRDSCQWELYDYGNITSDYPNYPVMTRERWNIDNIWGAQSNATKRELAAMLKAAYCDSRRLGVDRMGC